MITLITGVPGAGKTLYCIDKLLRGLVGTTLPHEVDGVVSDVERRIKTNINGLMLDHDKIDGGPAWVLKGGDMLQGDGNKLGLNNWHEWCRPGDVICFDEVQKFWPLQASGAKVSPCIEALETHRHMGVDFIVLTQHPMLVNSNLMRLVGRHLHVRRMGNMGLAIVYEWDSASRTLLYKNALAKAPYRYDKSVFKLYKSSELHTKQKRSTPTLIYGAILGLLVLMAITPTTFSRIGDRISPPAKVHASDHARVPALPSSGAGLGSVDSRRVSSELPAGLVPALKVEPVVSGCVAVPGRCECFDGGGKVVSVDPAVCLDRSGITRGPVLDLGPDSPVARVAVPGEFEALEFMAARRGSGSSGLFRQPVVAGGLRGY